MSALSSDQGLVDQGARVAREAMIGPFGPRSLTAIQEGGKVPLTPDEAAVIARRVIAAVRDQIAAQTLRDAAAEWGQVNSGDDFSDFIVPWLNRRAQELDGDPS